MYRIIVPIAAILVSSAACAAPKAGDPLPPFSLMSTTGARVSQGELAKTDLGILYFFSTQNCPACLSGLAQLKQLATQYDDHDMRIVAVGKQDIGTLKNAVPISGGHMQVIAADTGTLAAYNAQFVLPTTYVTGPGGAITKVMQGGGASTQAMLVSIAENQLQRSKPAEARDIFDTAAKLGGGSLARAGSAYSLLKAGKTDQAEKIFDAMAHSTNKEESLRGREGLAQVMLTRGDNDGALSAANAILAKSPKRVVANLVRARALHQRGDDGQAEKSLASATEDNAQGDFDFQRSEANVAQGNLLQKKAPRIALASFKTASRQNPHSVTAMSNLGTLEAQMGDPKKALETMRNALALAPGDKLLFSLIRQTQESIAQKQDLEYQRYIDQTVQDLSARFKQQQAQTKTNADDWTSPPMVVSILGFRDEGPTPLEGRIGLEGALQNELQRALMAKNIQVVDRAIMDKLLAELKLGSSDLADPDTQLKLGRILAARLIATGSLLNAANGQANMRLIDTETTGISLSTSDKLDSNPDPAALAEKMANEVQKTIHDKYPLKGRIAEVDNDGGVVINLGKKHGVQVGEEFNVLGEAKPIELNGKILGYRETKAGRIRVTEVQDNLAFAQAVDRNATWASNQRIIQNF